MGKTKFVMILINLDSFGGVATKRTFEFRGLFVCRSYFVLRFYPVSLFDIPRSMRFRDTIPLCERIHWKHSIASIRPTYD